MNSVPQLQEAPKLFDSLKNTLALVQTDKMINTSDPGAV